LVRDDGVGVPEDLDIEKTVSLGLRLVRSLAEQLGGDLELIRQNGTCFRIGIREYHEAGTVLY
jgi:two-component sensor histidine kinase